MTTPPAGWYDDGRGALRWWDGTQWTQHVHNATDATAHGAQQAAYPGTAAAEAPPKRSLWWIWLVAGAAVLVVFVVLALVFVPIALRAITGGVAGGGGEASRDSADERGAVATVETYERAWQTADCELMFTATTDDYRTELNLTDCDVFDDRASAFADTVTDYTMTVNFADVQDDGTVLVNTTESYSSQWDASGNDTGTEKDYTQSWTYTVVQESDNWLIDAEE